MLRIADGLDGKNLPVMTVSRAALIGFATGRIGFDKAIDENMVKVDDKKFAKRFFSYVN